jgi:hypothetical protein
MPKDFITQLRELNAGVASQKNHETAQEERKRHKQGSSSTTPKLSSLANEGEKAATYSTSQQKQAFAKRSPQVVQ